MQWVKKQVKLGGVKLFYDYDYALHDCCSVIVNIWLVIGSTLKFEIVDFSLLTISTTYPCTICLIAAGNWHEEIDSRFDFL